MNEQMQKLELEAIAYADSKVPANDRYNDIYHSIVRGKFAELIVRECLDACSRATELRHFVPPTQEQVVLSCMREIEETFRS